MKESAENCKSSHDLPTNEDGFCWQEEEEQVCTMIREQTIFFFDLDGTLVNTDYANFLSYKTAISIVMGGDFSSLLMFSRERFNRSQLKSLFPSLTENEYRRIIQEKERCYKDYLPDTTLIKENVELLLKYSVSNKTVLVSNCRKERVWETLSYYGLVDKFTYMFYRETCQGARRFNKYRKAINQLGVSPDDIVAFENEKSEIADAMEAGIRIINPKIL